MLRRLALFRVPLPGTILERMGWCGARGLEGGMSCNSDDQTGGRAAGIGRPRVSSGGVATGVPPIASLKP